MTDPVLPGWSIRSGQEIQYGNGGALRCDAVFRGQRVVPTSGTVNIYAPGSSSALITDGTLNIDSTTKEMTYNLDASDTARFFLAEGFRATFDFSASGTDYPTRQIMFDIVRTPLLDYPPFSVDEMRAFAPRYNAMILNSEQTSKAQEHIRTAWEDTVKWLKSHFRRVSLLMDSADMSGILRNHSMMNAAVSARREAGDIWDKDIEFFAAQLKEARSMFRPRYSPGDDQSAVDMPAMQQPKLQWGSQSGDPPRGVLQWVRR